MRRQGRCALRPICFHAVSLLLLTQCGAGRGRAGRVGPITGPLAPIRAVRTPSPNKRTKESSKIANRKSKIASPIVSIIMGSKSDWPTMKHASDVLDEFRVPFETKIVSAHRTPDLLFEFAKSAESRGVEVIIAGAGGAAHLPGMCASQTLLPVLGVPVESRALKGLDSLLSIAQMPAGVPVGALAIGEAGAKNAALLAISILSQSRPALREKLRSFRSKQTTAVLKSKLK